MEKFPKILGVSLLLSVLVLFTGCIKMDVNQTIKSSGSSHVEVIYDVTEMMASMEEMGGDMTTEDSDPDATCADFIETATWDNPDCSIEEWVFTMSGDVTLGDPEFVLEGSQYRYDLKNLFTLLSDVGDSQDQDFSESSLEEQKSMVEMTGIELTYTLTMPGAITSADVGTYEGNVLTMDMFDLAGADSAYVYANAGGAIPWLYIAIGAGVLVLLLVVVMVVKKKK